MVAKSTEQAIDAIERIVVEIDALPLSPSCWALWRKHSQADIRNPPDSRIHMCWQRAGLLFPKA